MKCKFLLSTVFNSVTLPFKIISISTLMLFATSSNIYASNQDFKFNLQTKHGIDLSELTRGPLKVETLTDARDGLTGKQISESMSINIAVGDLLQDAIAQGFLQGGAKLEEQNPSQLMTGQITEFQATEDANTIEVVIRTNLQLKSSSGKVNWKGSMLGKGSVPASEGTNAALQKALDNFVGNLFYDDYLLIQLVE